jgi:hypothetical protein
VEEKNKRKLPRGIKRFIDEFNAAYSEATNDPLILSALEHLSLLLAQQFKTPYVPRDMEAVEGLRQCFSTRIDDIDLAWELAYQAIHLRAPRLAHHLGEALTWQIGETVYAWVMGGPFPLKPPDFSDTLRVLPYGNPLTLTSDRTLHGWQSASLEHFEQFLDWRDACRPPTRGRPRGRSNGHTVEHYIEIARLFDKKRMEPTMDRVATYLMDMRLRNADILGELSSKRLHVQRRSVKRTMERTCKKAGMKWSDVIRLARTAQ